MEQLPERMVCEAELEEDSKLQGMELESPLGKLRFTF